MAAVEEQRLELERNRRARENAEFYKAEQKEEEDNEEFIRQMSEKLQRDGVANHHHEPRGMYAAGSGLFSPASTMGAACPSAGGEDAHSSSPFYSNSSPDATAAAAANRFSGPSRKSKGEGEWYARNTAEEDTTLDDEPVAPYAGKSHVREERQSALSNAETEQRDEESKYDREIPREIASVDESAQDPEAAEDNRRILGEGARNTSYVSLHEID
jgi:hypothetical protein